MNTLKLINRAAGSKNLISRFSVFLLCCAFFVSATNAQQTAGGTIITNQASATYSDGTNSSLPFPILSR